MVRIGCRKHNLPETLLRLEIAMSRIILACSFAAALLVSGAVNANQSDWQRPRLACADVGIDPSSAAFGQCVVDLYYSLWNEQNAHER
jgi:hypothetical protein